MSHKMAQRRFFSQGAAAVACGAAMLLGAATASADGDKRGLCTAASVAYKSAATAEKAGHFHQASVLVSQCLEAAACGGLALRCAALSDKLTAEMPTVIPNVINEKGEPECNVEVKVDGETLTSSLDGRGLPVEAGLHEFTFSTDHGVIATQKVLVLEGQRNRPVTVSMGPVATETASATWKTTTGKPSATKVVDEATTPDMRGQSDSTSETTSPPTPSAGEVWVLPRSPFPYVLGAVGLAAVTGGALLSYWGMQDNTDLQNSCKPNCSSTSVDHVKTMYLAADIAFGAGALALGVTTWIIARSRGEKSPHAQSATGVDIHPTPSGAFASVSGAF